MGGPGTLKLLMALSGTGTSCKGPNLMGRQPYQTQIYLFFVKTCISQIHRDLVGEKPEPESEIPYTVSEAVVSLRTVELWSRS